MNVSCEIEEYFENWRDWFLLKEDKEEGLFELFVNNEKITEKNVLNHFSLIQCKLKITNFDGVVNSVGFKFSGSSLSCSRTLSFPAVTMSSGLEILISYDIRRE